MKLLSYVPDVITEKFRGYSHAPPVQSSVALPERTPLACSLVKAGGFLVRLAGISGALAVALGAYGAHVLFKRDDIPEERKEAFDRANHYHCLHTLAILAAPLTRRPALVGTLLVVGTTVFCGSCYIYALTGNDAVKMAAPYGGTTLILAWLSMVL